MKDPYREKKKRLKTHKYLEDLGLPRRRCGTNFTRRTKIMRREKKAFGFDRRETYDVGDMFAQWLYEHLRMYIAVAGRIIDIDDTITGVGLEGDDRMTIREGVCSVLEPLKEYLILSKDYDPDYELQAREMLREAAQRWAVVAPYVNW